MPHHHDRRDARSRSRSPYRTQKEHSPRHRGFRSPYRRQRHESSRHKHQRSSSPKPIALPFRATPLSRRDLDEYKSIFALYLDIQKQLVLDELDEHEVKGRWKSFVGKWNHGELAEGWYDPATKRKAVQSFSSTAPETNPAKRQRRESPVYGSGTQRRTADESDEDEFGPAPPGEDSRSRRPGPAIPSMQDLELRDELYAEDSANRIADLRYDRKLDRKEQKERLEELVPRADPGSRERQLEKKREKTATLNSFREAKSPGAEEVGEGDLLGDDGIDAYKKRRKEVERKKNEREIRKEEILRARAAEREERLAEHRAKEEKTMEMLKALAKQRFGQ